MALITFSGTLEAGPILVDSKWPSAQVAEFVVVERTGRYAKEDWVADAVPTRRRVLRDPQAVATVMGTLRAGTHVMVTGREFWVVRAVRIAVLLVPEQEVTVTATPGRGSWWPADV